MQPAAYRVDGPRFTGSSVRNTYFRNIVILGLRSSNPIPNVISENLILKMSLPKSEQFASIIYLLNRTISRAPRLLMPGSRQL